MRDLFLGLSEKQMARVSDVIINAGLVFHAGGDYLQQIRCA